MVFENMQSDILILTLLMKGLIEEMFLNRIKIAGHLFFQIKLADALFEKY